MKLIKMNEIHAVKVNQLWYPYIPFGKITHIQSDPGDGKTTFVLAVAALLTNGNLMPETESTAESVTVIYQTAEDGLADTAVGIAAGDYTISDFTFYPLKFKKTIVLICS